MSTQEPLAPLVAKLRAWGLHGLAATLLEQAGPLAFFGAQALYVAAPALQLLTPGETVTALAHALEDPDAAAALARRLEAEA